MTLGDFGTATAVLSNQPLEDDVRIPKMNGWDIINKNSLQTKQTVLISITYSKSPTNIPHLHLKKPAEKKLPKVGPQVGRIFPVLDGKIKPLIQRDPLEDADSKDRRILVTCHFFYTYAVGGCKNKNIRRAFHDHHGNLVSSRNFEWSKSFLLQCCRQIHKPRCTKWKFCFVSNLTVDGFRVFVFIMPLTGTA